MRTTVDVQSVLMAFLVWSAALSLPCDRLERQDTKEPISYSWVVHKVQVKLYMFVSNDMFKISKVLHMYILCKSICNEMVILSKCKCIFSLYFSISKWSRSYAQVWVPAFITDETETEVLHWLNTNRSPKTRFLSLCLSLFLSLFMRECGQWVSEWQWWTCVFWPLFLFFSRKVHDSAIGPTVDRGPTGPTSSFVEEQDGAVGSYQDQDQLQVIIVMMKHQ